MSSTIITITVVAEEVVEGPGWGADLADGCVPQYTSGVNVIHRKGSKVGLTCIFTNL